MQVDELLRDLDFGKSVAEFDEGLDRYFVDTEVFDGLTRGSYDIIAGDKGTGKTALYRVLRKRYATVPTLNKTEVVTGFNITGNPVFQQLVHLPALSEGQYRSIWKTFVFSLVANWLVLLFDGQQSRELRSVADILDVADLKSFDDSAETVFSKIVKSVSRWIKPKSVEAEMSFSETGLPVVKPKLEFDQFEAKETLHKFCVHSLIG